MGDIALPIDGVPVLPRGERLLSDERLAKLAARGNARAFAALYARNHQAIYRYCRSILRHDHDAQDALQNTMMRAHAALCAQERDLAVRPWLFRIAHNEAISLLRKRRPSAELSEDHEPLDGGVEAAMEARERLSTLVADLQALPERQRAALLMRELSGLSIEEIAGALAISGGAAKQTLFEARSSLHELTEGRAMPCEAVMEAISSGDGRVLRGRRIRAHLRACEECRSFRAAIDTRSADLRALAPPLPAFAAGTLLARLLGQAGGHSGGATVSGASLGGHAAASFLTKGIAGVAVVAAAAAGTARLAAGHHSGAPHSGGPAIPRQASEATQASPLPGISMPRTSTLDRPAIASPADHRATSGQAGSGMPNIDTPATTGSTPMSGRPGLAVNGEASRGHGQMTAHGHSQRTESDSRQTGKRGHDNRHQHEGQGSTGGRRAHHPAKPHGSGPHRPSREPKRSAGQGAGEEKSPARPPETPAGETPERGAATGSAQMPPGSEAAGAPGIGRSGEARQSASPQSASAHERAAPR